MIVRLIVVNISQCIQILDYYVVHLKLICYMPVIPNFKKPKTVLQEILKDINKWKHIPRSWIGRHNISFLFPLFFEINGPFKIDNS